LLISYVISDTLADKIFKNPAAGHRIAFLIILESIIIFGLFKLSAVLNGMTISSGTNALNVSVVLAIMALPTIVSVSEDSLQAVGRDLREGSYALGATRAETLVKVVIPAAKSGIVAAVILGVMRAIGETMVVWMASGNAAQIPQPWYNIFEPIRTLTATIAGDMGEADHITGSARYHVLFAMALFLLLFSFISNLISEWFVVRSKKKWGV
jgi:phosphate transport system permease protein